MVQGRGRDGFVGVFACRREFCGRRGRYDTEFGLATAESLAVLLLGTLRAVVLGLWLRLVGGPAMWTFFWFSVAAQILFGIIAIATAVL